MKTAWLGFVLIGGLAGVAFAEPDSQELATIQGKVAFEKRSTIVPFCAEDFCPQPEPYWALVLFQRGVMFELAPGFAQGSNEAPESIEVAGTIIRPGSFVVIEGDVRMVSRSYGIVEDVRRAGLLMDRGPIGLPYEPRADQISVSDDLLN